MSLDPASHRGTFRTRQSRRPVFRPVTNGSADELEKARDLGSVYHSIIRKFGRETGISAQVNGSAFTRCARPRGDERTSHRYRQGPGVAKACECFDDAPL